MRTVFSSQELPHIWAHQSAPHGRVGNCSFVGDIFYSYAAPIGCIVRRKGVTAYLLAQRLWSKTTSSHQNDLRRAVPGNALVLYCDRIGDTPRKMLQYCLGEAAAAAGRAERARINKDWHFSEQAAWLDRARDTAKFYGLRNKIDNAAINRLRVAQQRAETARRKARVEQQAALEVKQAGRIAAWQRGESVDLYGLGLDRCYLRAIGDTMETSRGAIVPLKDARRVLRLILKIRKSGVDWRRNGENIPIGGYQLDAVNANGVVAGCHRFDWEEIDRFATAQGWMK